MTQAEFNILFKYEILPNIKKIHEQDNKINVDIRRDGYNNHLHTLNKSGIITENQVNDWYVFQFFL